MASSGAAQAFAAKVAGVTTAVATSVLGRLGIGGAAAAGSGAATIGAKATAVCVGVVCAATAGGEIAGVLPSCTSAPPDAGRHGQAREGNRSRADAADGGQRGAQRNAGDSIPGALRRAHHGHTNPTTDAHNNDAGAGGTGRPARRARFGQLVDADDEQLHHIAVDGPVEAVGAGRLESHSLDRELGADTEPEHHGAARPPGLRTRRPWMLKSRE